MLSLTENQEQIDIIRWWDEHCSEYNLPPKALAHICNEQKDARRRALNAKLGVRNGFPDLILCVPNKDFHGLFIELKRESRCSKKNPLAGLSEEQIAYREFLKSMGYESVVCYGSQHAIATIKMYLKGL